jgi:hypothetical protein
MTFARYKLLSTRTAKVKTNVTCRHTQITNFIEKKRRHKIWNINFCSDDHGIRQLEPVELKAKKLKAIQCFGAIMRTSSRVN